MPFIRTVLGDVEASLLGVCYAHEHIVIDASYPTEKSPDFLLGDVELITQELKVLYEAGGRAVIDSMPCDCGRNASKLAEVSRRSGIHIVAPTGLHLQKYYPHGHWGERLHEVELARLFIADIDNGIDANDYGGPDVQRTEIRAGVIKVAGGRDQLSVHERKCFRAAARAQQQTGAPILTHTEQGTAALEQIEVLSNAGASLGHVVLSHLDRNFDVNYHRKVLSSGVSLEYDSAFRWKSDENPTLKLLAELLPEFPDQIMLGMDAARRSYWKAFGGAPGLSFLLDAFVARMRAVGIDDELINKIFVHNPARVYAFFK